MTKDEREYPARPIAGVGVVVCKEGAVLLIRRGNPPRRGEWSIPGGVVKVGETWRAAAQREVREECGVKVHVGAIVDAIDIVARDETGRVQYHYAVVDFAARYVRGKVRAASDVMEARWVPLDELDALALPEQTRAVIGKAIRMTKDE